MLLFSLHSGACNFGVVIQLPNPNGMVMKQDSNPPRPLFSFWLRTCLCLKALIWANLQPSATCAPSVLSLSLSWMMAKSEKVMLNCLVSVVRYGLSIWNSQQSVTLEKMINRNILFKNVTVHNGYGKKAVYFTKKSGEKSTDCNITWGDRKTTSRMKKRTKVSANLMRAENKKLPWAGHIMPWTDKRKQSGKWGITEVKADSICSVAQ